ncbi:uncharacterized protein LOC131684593 [Topomyia yanbarensis]|uniref:uncharacterized protein LOC131684593 n=1 Tax=Topomyia yanbarensis TaxID=2498891 RepID=UPI00273B5FCC|nr:uncharacterized protein LOC131684593 [Topomyia yanbarensis]
MDEDVEFRDMVLKKLEENGSLLDLKAKLRAHLYDVIENDGKLSELKNSELIYNGDKSELDEDEDEPEEQNVDNRSLSLSLVFDLLDCLNLAYTKRVLMAESGTKKPFARDRLRREFLREPISEENDFGEDAREAILYKLINQHRKESPSISKTEEIPNEESTTS